ncbi:hypothetical protein [Streptomyces albicerus]|jgi:hypothetical protein|uniref:hypothetical protein n=1 Tax=Streptomyces albicerus TaxID=2569859 RepID=UPI00124B042A|nr:hypothetical protein [Streptomyces albicerus]
MGMQDQFKDKSEQLQQNAKKKFGEGQHETSERGQLSPEERERLQRERQQRGRQTPDETERAQREAQDRFDQDYDV